jgi:hypothetical protein
LIFEIGRDRARRRTDSAGGCLGSGSARVAHNGRMPLLGRSVTERSERNRVEVTRTSIRTANVHAE